MKWIVMSEALAAGSQLEFYGPFDTEDDANEWIWKNLNKEVVMQAYPLEGK